MSLSTYRSLYHVFSINRDALSSAIPILTITPSDLRCLIPLIGKPSAEGGLAFNVSLPGFGAPVFVGLVEIGCSLLASLFEYAFVFDELADLIDLCFEIGCVFSHGR